MPLAAALLCHPAGAYGCTVAALAAGVYAWHTRRFVPAFTAASAAALTVLAFLHVPPPGCALIVLVLGVALLQWELLAPTYGAAFVAGFALTLFGSWLLLGPTPGASAMLTTPARLAAAALGTLTLHAAVLRGFRLYTLSRH